jgi:eukaryotic-like serine/threonine-protein kinase
VGVGPTDRATARYLAEHPLLVAGRRLGGRYLLRRPLGHGGMAAVWLATDERLGRQVAIKVLSDTVVGNQEFLDRFRREARVAAGLQHPNLVQVYDFGAGDRPYLVMEYIEGGNLAQRFAEHDPPAAERLARELLSALRHIHSNGVLHRDVKPHNVLIDANGHARLTDFGVAQPSDETALTEAGKVIGTESYMAPEVRAGDPATERSDLYATGVVLAEAAREGASAALWSLIDRLRERLPTRRPASATAALAMLERAATPVVQSEPTEAFDPEPRAQSPDRRRALALAALLAALIALATIALASLLSGGGDGGNRSAAGGPAANADDSQASAPDQQASDQGANDAGGGAAASPDTSSDPSPSGAALNDQGYALIQAGSYDEAIPILQRAVSELEGSSDELTYGYALFNLAHALRLAGRPDEAIPLLEQRLQIPDQQPEVQAELAVARADAGVAEPADGAVKPPKGDKPDKGAKSGHGPPPTAGGGGDGALNADE